MDKKKLLVIIAIITIAIAIGVIIINKDNKEEEFKIDGIDLPTNKEILKDANVDNLKITNISLLTRDGISTYKATILNNTENDIKINILYIIFYENEIEHKAVALYDTEIQTKGEKYINITSDKDLSNITKIEYVLE
jgi:hypothetical protein